MKKLLPFCLCATLAQSGLVIAAAATQAEKSSISVTRIAAFATRHPQKTGRAMTHSISEVRTLRKNIEPVLQNLKQFPAYIEQLLTGVLGIVTTSEQAISTLIPSLNVFETEVTNELTDLDPGMQQQVRGFKESLTLIQQALQVQIKTLGLTKQTILQRKRTARATLPRKARAFASCASPRRALPAAHTLQSSPRLASRRQPNTRALHLYKQKLG